jgi:methylenetetrahydrofolate dehydrogenase (NADP+)/methenyltetrahydrofolate cyclohydrolase
MSCYIFNGAQLAEKREKKLKNEIEIFLSNQADQLAKAKVPHIAAVLFSEDKGSVLYSTLKQQVAERVGMKYTLHKVTISQSVSEIVTKITQLNQDQSITGIIIQKPRRSIWAQANHLEGSPKDIKAAFDTWWQLLTSQINPKKDVDGLHPETYQAIVDGTWQAKGKVLPATVKAVLIVLKEVQKLEQSSVLLENKKQKNIVILGKSDLLGKPLYALLTRTKYVFDSEQVTKVSLWGRAELKRAREQGRSLLDADIIISATGVPGLITAADVSEGCVLIDVGEPRPDFDLSSTNSVLAKAAFLSPVPGGVGPLTVVSLLESGFKIFRPR